MNSFVSLVKRPAIFLLLVLGLTPGCAAVQTSPGALEYASPVTLGTRVFQAPPSEQTAKVQVNVAYRTFQVRLSEPPVCYLMINESLTGHRRIAKKLGQKDEIIKWSGYGIAALTGLHVAIGLIRGQDPGRGFVLLGIYTLPFAAVGAAQSYRELDVTEPVPAVQRTRRGAIVDCPREHTELEVDVYVGPEIAPKMRLDTAWQRVEVPFNDKVSDSTFSVPLAVGPERLAAYILGEPVSGDKIVPSTDGPEAAPSALTGSTAPSAPTGSTSPPAPVKTLRAPADATDAASKSKKESL